jgi:hypothetical protein
MSTMRLTFSQMSIDAVYIFTQPACNLYLGRDGVLGQNPVYRDFDGSKQTIRFQGHDGEVHGI